MEKIDRRKSGERVKVADIIIDICDKLDEIVDWINKREDKDGTEGYLEFMESMGRRIRSGSYQFLFQLDPCDLTRAIGQALGKFQEALQKYRENML